MTGTRQFAHRKVRVRKAVAEAAGFAAKWSARVGELDASGRVVPPSVREGGARLIAWAMRRCP